MGRQPCCDKVGLKKGPWTAEEDRRLLDFIFRKGPCSWRALPKLAGLLRCGKSCRLRWINYLRPDLKRGLLSDYEEKLVIDLHATLGNRWSKIAAHLPGRTDNDIKNYWNTRIRKKLTTMGIDPATHRPLGESADDEKKKPREREDEREEEEDAVSASLSSSDFLSNSPAYVEAEEESALKWRPESPLWGSFGDSEDWSFTYGACDEELPSDLFTTLDHVSWSPLR